MRVAGVCFGGGTAREIDGALMLPAMPRSAAEIRPDQDLDFRFGE